MERNIINLSMVKTWSKRMTAHGVGMHSTTELDQLYAWAGTNQFLLLIEKVAFDCNYCVLTITCIPDSFDDEILFEGLALIRRPHI